MSSVFLTQVGGILKPIAWLLGIILNAIYEFIGFFGIHNIAICIILFTFVTKMLMLPLTIKQQKYSRLQSKMSPELTKVQAKYKGKKDEESLRKMQAETQEIYAKYGTSPMGGCLPMLISLPIMFALYRVIYAVPAYVTDIGSLYSIVADAIMQVSDHATIITNFIADNAVTVVNELATYAVGSQEYTNSLIDILANFNTANWGALIDISEFAHVGNLMTTVSSESVNVVNEIMSANNLFGLSILDRPAWNSVSVLIPILAAASQFLQGKLQMSSSLKKSETTASDNPMANSTKTMTTIMPIMSGVFCLMFPIGVGLYWIASAVFQVLQQIFINRYLDKTGVDELIEKNIQKSNKKKAKMGIAPGTKMASVAKTPTKAIDTSKPQVNKTKESISNYAKSDVSYSSKSIAANANLLKNLNKNNDSKKVNKSNKSNGNASKENKDNNADSNVSSDENK